ncbi:MAG: glycosyltransferase family 92 protein [Candidatus Limnocylindrales bacterium]
MTLRRRLGRMIPGGAEPASSPPPGPGRTERGTKGKMLRAKPPNVVGRGPLLDGPGFGVVIVCIVKDEAEYLEEWLGYHIAVGVDHFLIYDNGSSDGSAALLERYINHGLVTRIDWPLGGGQLAAYNHALRMFGATARWLAYYDVDEFLVPLLDDDVPTFLARFEDAAVVRVPRVEFGFSGHRVPPPGLAIEAYTQVANVLDLDADLPPRVKSMVQPGAVSAVDIHLAFPADEPATGKPTTTAEASVRGIAQLNHYYTRSFEEYEAKRFRGSATGRIDRPAVPFDIETLGVDTSARRFVARTQATLERLRGLDAKPYAYGSQLALEYFPRPNDLFRFGEFAIANTAAGLAQPSRVAATRLRNLHRGVGLITDLAESGYQPVRDGLSSSIHTGVLVEHMRGRMATSLSTADDLPMMAAVGTLAIPDAGAAALLLPAGSAEVLLQLPADDMLRCYYLGFLASVSAPVRLEAAVTSAKGDASQPVELRLPASTAVAGIVEIEPRPVHGEWMRLVFETDADEIDLHDLFVIATG